MKGLETIYRLPIQGYLPAAAEALLTGCLPSAIPVTIQIGRSGAVQEFRLDQLQAFSDALAPCGPEGARALLQSLCAAVLDCPRLLDPALQVFVPDRMFWDGRQSEWRFLLLAGVNDAWTQDDAVDAERLWRTVLTEAMECAPNAREYLQRVWERFQTAPLSAEALRDTLRSVTLTPSTEEIADRDKDCRIWENPPASLGGWSEEFQFPEQPAGEGGGKGTTGTILLPIPGIQRNPRLRRITTQETVPINAERFIIGTSPELASFVIHDNNTISRQHACITVSNGRYILRDMNSRNGVFIDNRRLASNDAEELKNGDVFQLSNEYFRLEW